MRALILAAGLGERMQPLSQLRPKPALPQRGIPLIGYTLEWLAHHGCEEVVVNLHHKPELLRETVEAERPASLSVQFSHEPELLGTGGAVRRVRDFLSGSDPSLLVGGDMLLDADLTKLADLHRARGDAVTLLLLENDPRADQFGTIGVDAHRRVRRIGSSFDLGGETQRGIYVHAMAIAPRALATLPDREVFNHLTDWLAPLLADGAEDICAEVWGSGECCWVPVGTPDEYLRANFEPPRLSYLDADARARERGVRVEADRVIGAKAKLGADVELHRAVIWDGEQVPDGFRGQDGVFAGGQFFQSPGWEPGS